MKTKILLVKKEGDSIQFHKHHLLLKPNYKTFDTSENPMNTLAQIFDGSPYFYGLKQY
jgi:hypothetical protein